MTELSDTTPAAERRLHELYRAMSLEQRWRLLSEVQATADAFALAGIRMRHPHADERELTLRLAALRYPRELMVRAFGWDPEVQGH